MKCCTAKGTDPLTGVNAANRTDGTPARCLALRFVEFNPAKRNSVAQGFLQTAWKHQEKAFQLINEQHLEQLPMHEFLVRIRAQLLWAGHGWTKPKHRHAAGLKFCRLISHSNSSVHGNVDSMLAGPGDLDNARSQLNRLENLLGNGKYHSDWISNANKVGSFTGK